MKGTAVTEAQSQSASTASLHIRRYEPGDQSAVWALHLSGLNETGTNPGDGEWHKDVADIAKYYLDGGVFLVGELNGEIVAMGGLRRVNNELGELRRLRVKTEYRRFGFGEKILQLREDIARGLGYKKLVFTTTENQVASQKLHEKNGYVEVSRDEISVQGRNYKVIFYEKAL